MNKETYEALKEVVKYMDTTERIDYSRCKSKEKNNHVYKDVLKIKTWIDEVAKKYEGETKITHCLHDSVDWYKASNGKCEGMCRDCSKIIKLEGDK